MFDAVTYGAAVGAAKRYTDEHSGSDDAVKYTEQSLTSEQQAQARENIGAAASDDIPTDAVKCTAQTLTDAQKTQARTNIGASDFNGDYRNLTNAPPLVKGTGTGGNTIGGTGGTAMNSAKNLNSYAYGYLAGAYANYAFAFGDRAFAGNSNRNTGKHAVAIGNNVSAEKDYEFAYGKFNQSNADTVFSIGDGTSENNRHNLIELKTNGQMFLNGNAVKTEGGDDNKLRLGQIWIDMGYEGSYPVYGFGLSRGKGNGFPKGFVFLTQEYIDLSAVWKVFGDFACSYSTYSSNPYQNKVVIQPLGGRTAGKPTTGAWILVENCFRMFYKDGSSDFTALDISMFDTSECRNMTEMFSGCTYLETLDLSSFDMSNVIEYTDMFTNDTALTTLKTPKINPHDDIPLPRTLYSQDGTAYTTLPVTTGTSIELRQSWT